MKKFDYYKPRCQLDLSNSLWYDKTIHDETFYHFVTFQIRRKYKRNALLFVFFGVSFVFTSLCISDVIDKLVEDYPIK